MCFTLCTSAGPLSKCLYLSLFLHMHSNLRWSCACLCMYKLTICKGESSKCLQNTRQSKTLILKEPSILYSKEKLHATLQYCLMEDDSCLNTSYKKVLWTNDPSIQAWESAQAMQFFHSICVAQATQASKKAKWDVQSNVETGKSLSKQQLGSSELFSVAW